MNQPHGHGPQGWQYQQGRPGAQGQQGQPGPQAVPGAPLGPGWPAQQRPPYGAVPPGGGPPAPRGADGLSITALVLGILALLGAGLNAVLWLPLAGIALTLSVLAVLAARSARRPIGMAATGLVLIVIAIALRSVLLAVL